MTLRGVRAAALALLLAAAAVAAPVYVFVPTVSVTVGTSATGLALKTGHAFVLLCNNDAAKTLYWSFDSAVTTSTGTPLLPGSPCLPFTGLARGQLIYGVTTSGSLDARVTEAFLQ